MALTRANYLEHYRGILGRYFAAHPEGVEAFGPIFTDYIATGTRGTAADRREACRTVANLLWTGVLSRQYNAHAMRHFFLDNADTPRLPEPTS